VRETYPANDGAVPARAQNVTDPGTAARKVEKV
jgi:hypothetical protein